MCVCVYVCMFVCMYVCMYACMHVWVYVCVYICACIPVLHTVIQPPSVLGSLISILDSDTIGDLSVSRSSSRLPWGIPVPGDSSQTVSL